MSLVAYGASDESDQSGTEDNEEFSTGKKKSVKDQISDDEEYQAVSVSSSSSSLLSDFPLNNVAFDTFSSVTVNQDLPPPQKRENVTIEETELEEEVRQKPSELADAPKPPSKRTKQPVKITIPSLDEIPDEEEGDSKKKATISSSKPSGLFSLLPAPIHSAKKEINRPLIPHSLAKKPAVQAKSVSSSKSGSSNSNSGVQITDNSSKPSTTHEPLIGYGSDDDDDDDDGDDDEDETGTSSNFFSLGSSSAKTSKETDSVSSTSGNNRTNVTLNAELETRENSTSEETATSSSQGEKEEEAEEEVVMPEPGLTNDSPLDFGNASRFSSWSSASSSYLGGFVPNRHPSCAYESSSYLQSTFPKSSVQYNMVDANDTEDICTDVISSDLQQVMNDKEFQKMHGKRKRGMEEAISFVDAKVDDYVDPSELSKYITEETDYTSKKNKDDMPTSQQKRKKQITYLAFQAKEKELELKNTWSQNRLTKRQTQAKYGF